MYGSKVTVASQYHNIKGVVHIKDKDESVTGLTRSSTMYSCICTELI